MTKKQQKAELKAKQDAVKAAMLADSESKKHAVIAKCGKLLSWAEFKDLRDKLVERKSHWQRLANNLKIDAQDIKPSESEMRDAEREEVIFAEHARYFSLPNEDVCATKYMRKYV